MKSLLKPEIKKWFDKSIKSELYASNLYKHFANQFQRMGLFGCQKYFLKESEEELNHYQKLVDFINDMGDVASISAIPTMIDINIDKTQKALQEAYDFELELMKQYQNFYEDAEDLKDCITSTFLIEFMQIQRKSIGEYGDLISRLERNPTDIFEFDEYIGEL